MSNAVESAVKLAELIKHRIKGLHQSNKISHITIVDEYEPLEEGLDHLGSALQQFSADGYCKHLGAMNQSCANSFCICPNSALLPSNLGP